MLYLMIPEDHQTEIFNRQGIQRSGSQVFIKDGDRLGIHQYLDKKLNHNSG